MATNSPDRTEMVTSLRLAQAAAAGLEGLADAIECDHGTKLSSDGLSGIPRGIELQTLGDGMPCVRRTITDPECPAVVVVMIVESFAIGLLRSSTVPAGLPVF